MYFMHNVLGGGCAWSSGKQQIGESGMETAGVPSRHGRNGIGHGHRGADHPAKHAGSAILEIEIGGIVGEINEPLAGGAIRVTVLFVLICVRESADARANPKVAAPD